jgi:putative tryptophan/tyrosine transport system substrate-binding protein
VRRREFIGLLGGTLAAWPYALRAQQPPKAYRIAIVSPSAAIAEMNETGEHFGFAALFKELRRLGYVEGQNLIVERYSAGGREERYSELARDVARGKPNVIVAATTLMVLTFKALIATIPIVAIMADPVAFGVVTSLGRPGGNITGISVDAGLEVWAKRLQILREAVPTASRVGFLASRAVWDKGDGSVMRQATRQTGITLLGPPLESPLQDGEYKRVLEVMVQDHADGLIVGDSPDNLTRSQLIVDLIEKARLPAVYPYREFFEFDGLIAYGSSRADVWGRLAGYIDQILKGAKPSELPIYRETKLELLLNLKAAKALGIKMPASLLARADEVIE